MESERAGARWQSLTGCLLVDEMRQSQRPSEMELADAGLCWIEVSHPRYNYNYSTEYRRSITLKSKGKHDLRVLCVGMSCQGGLASHR